MKRSVLLGLFVTASMLASSSFAAGGTEDLCEANLQTIANAKNQIKAPDVSARVEASVQQAKAHQAQNTKEGTEKCISETTQTIQDIQKVSKDGKNS
ncbi:hypothetical protein ACWA6H_24725 [Pseudomonas bijieensis]|jgi:hypothetical protein|uniref:hypothetical protein n=1 Tax=Pseudomonas TaxID=286 RepID=UPI000E312912|nr:MULTISPECIES: hypothetical protein [Pseudomonas]AXP06961.1 hypothetical protein DZG01_29920 [Pseudomonas fluorescens]QIB05099.1 hypothetical protein GZ982_10430 [Pseudomonas fluorescens]UQI31974.1 hypothetical protein M3M50_04950 [Pseudomonas bijieensis]BBH31278.1 hypothetical protein PBDP_0815 [Pseudomonas sp. St290]